MVEGTYLVKARIARFLLHWLPWVWVWVWVGCWGWKFGIGVLGWRGCRVEVEFFYAASVPLCEPCSGVDRSVAS